MDKKENYLYPLRPCDELAARILTDAFIRMWGNNDNEAQSHKIPYDFIVAGNPKTDRRARVISQVGK